MSALAHTTPAASPFPTKAEVLALRRTELAYARALGLGVGVFLVAWAPFSLSRWMGLGPSFATFEAGFLLFYGILLLLPYSRVLPARIWRVLLGLLAIASLAFVFVLVFDVLYIANLYVDNHDIATHAPPPSAVYEFSEESGTSPRLPFPALNCILVFLALLQVPAVLFSRHPDWLD